MLDNLDYNKLEYDKSKEYIDYDDLLLDINIVYIINKIKIVPIKNLSMILNYNNDFNINRITFDNNKYDYEIIKINKLTVGIKDTEIEEVFPKNNESIYSSIIQYNKNFYIKNNSLKDINSRFRLLFVEKKYIDDLSDQEIALYLFTLQYWNYLLELEAFIKYEWIDNILALVKNNGKSFIYSLKLKKKDIENFYNKCKNYKYDFENINIEKQELETDDQKEIIKYLGFGVFDIFNHKIFNNKI